MMHPLFSGILNAHGMTPTFEEAEALQQRYDGPVPAQALTDLRRQTHSAARHLAEVRTVLAAAELSVSEATRYLTRLVDERAPDAQIGNARMDLEEALDALHLARIQVGEAEAAIGEAA